LLKDVWGKNQHGKGKVFSRNQTEKCYQEVEIRLRSSLTPHNCTGYEVFWRCLKTPKAYVEIVRWNGKVKDWTSLKKHIGAKYGVKDGDLVEVVGSPFFGPLEMGVPLRFIDALTHSFSAAVPAGRGRIPH